MQQCPFSSDTVSSSIADHLAKNTFVVKPVDRAGSDAKLGMPAVQATAGMGGGGMHPGVAKHLRSQESSQG